MSWPKGPRGKRRIWRKFAKGFDEGNDLGRRALSKAANLALALYNKCCVMVKRKMNFFMAFVKKNCLN